MNLYFVDAGELDVVQDRIDYWEIWGVENVCGLVVAPNRAAAKYMFWKENKHDLGDLTETRLSVKVIGLDVRDRMPGVLDGNDPYWCWTCPDHWGVYCDAEVNHLIDEADFI